MSATPAVVHLVDDDPSFLKALSRMLRAAEFAVAAFDSAVNLLANVSSASRGCIVADLNMPAMGGLDLQAELLKRGLRLPVIFLTGEGDIPSSVRAMRLGAEDFLEKCAPQKQLVAAIQRALARDAYDSDRRSVFARLTSRELEVLQQVVRGRLNKQIASTLNIHERTVKLHRTSITTKLDVHSVAELTQLAQQAGLLDLATFP